MKRAAFVLGVGLVVTGLCVFWENTHWRNTEAQRWYLFSNGVEAAYGMMTVGAMMAASFFVWKRPETA